MRIRPALLIGLSALSALCALSLPGAAAAAAPDCRLRADGPPPRVVELYTSEGCNSCPPADRWLSTLRGRTDVLAAAFHVDYWDRLGWVDRFASPAHTARQAARQAGTGARFNYTPQVLVDGRDWRRWPELPAAGAASGVLLELERRDERVQLRVTTRAGAPTRIGLWWGLLEDGHASSVQAGENAGVRLQHDHVVRRTGMLPAWVPQPGVPTLATLDAPRIGEAGRTARLLVVVHDAAPGGRTLQAAQLACGPA
jgi:hypothetical protein